MRQITLKCARIKFPIKIKGEERQKKKKQQWKVSIKSIWHWLEICFYCFFWVNLFLIMFSINYAATHFSQKSFLTSRARVYLITAKKSGGGLGWAGFYLLLCRTNGRLLTAVNVFACLGQVNCFCESPAIDVRPKMWQSCQKGGVLQLPNATLLM